MKKGKKQSVPVLKDIAEAVGVSVMTVSNVLRPTKKVGRPLFSAKTARRVKEMAEKLGYFPNRAARAMRTRQTGVIGYVGKNFSSQTGTVQNFVITPFLVGLNHIFAPLGRHVTLVELNELELLKGNQLPTALRERFFDAIVVHFGLSPQALHVWEEFKVPLIYWDSGIFGKENCIYRDENKVAETITEKFLSLGHRRIAFLADGKYWRAYQTGESLHFSFSARYEGFATTMRKRGLKPRTLSGYDIAEMANQIRADRITAIIVQGVTDCMSIFRASMLLGKTIPHDISILSCDVESSVLDYGAGCGGVQYNRYQTGRRVAEMLVKRMDNDGTSVPSVCLPIELVEGSSVMPVNRNASLSTFNQNP